MMNRQITEFFFSFSTRVSHIQQLVSIYSKQVDAMNNFIANAEFYLLSFLCCFPVIKIHFNGRERVNALFSLSTCQLSRVNVICA